MTKSTPIAELKRLSASELRKEISLKRASYARHRIGITMQSEKNHAACRLLRRDLARMAMVLNDLERAPKSQTPLPPHRSKAPSAGFAGQEKPTNNDINQSSDSSLSSIPPLSSGPSPKKPVKGVRSKSKKAA